MNKTAVFVVILFLMAGVVFAKEFKIKKDEGLYDIEAKIDNNPPVVGNNNISIEIKEKSGKYVTNAKVVVEYSMPAMPGMPAMHYKEPAVLSGNTYKAVMNLSMAGSWNIEVKINKDGKNEKNSKTRKDNKTVKFSVDAH
jgi:hypothetical protein